MEKANVVLVDDHAVLRAGLKAMLDAQPDMRVIGEASDGLEAVELARRCAPDVVVLDLTMPRQGGMASIAMLKRACPTMKVLVLTMHEERSFLNAAIGAGADGYVTKSSAGSELIGAIRTVREGRSFVGITQPGPAPRVGEALGDAPGRARLTEREQEVLGLIARGYSNKEIAQPLGISVKTVETHRARIYEKLGVRTRAELVKYAIATGLLTGTG